MRSNEATPLSSQATASPSIMQERERSRESNDQREATGKIIARTAIEAHSRAVFPGNNPKAIVLDLMQPLAAGRQLRGFGWETRRDEPRPGGYAATCGLNGQRRLQLPTGQSPGLLGVFVIFFVVDERL